MALPALSDVLPAGPAASIAAVLRPYQSELQTLCFLDNEHGDTTDANFHLTRRVLKPAARRLSRAGKGIQLVGLHIDKSRLHTLVAEYQQADDRHRLHFLVFQPSDRARAQERRAEQDGLEWERGAPRRGRGAPRAPEKPRMCSAKA